jgi:hypothetical protein
VTVDRPRHQAEAGVPETRYARSGDVHVAYQTLGDGPGDLVFVAGFTSHCEHQEDIAELATAGWATPASCRWSAPRSPTTPGCGSGGAAGNACPPARGPWPAWSASPSGVLAAPRRRLTGRRRAQPQNAAATAVSASAQAAVDDRLTHSTSAWAPSPAGPNSTVGIPAADRNAESAQ